jgi:hypothetical protein
MTYLYHIDEFDILQDSKYGALQSQKILHKPVIGEDTSYRLEIDTIFYMEKS